LRISNTALLVSLIVGSVTSETRILASTAGGSVTVIVSLPSFGVLTASCSHVPFRNSSIFTLPVMPMLLQVIVCRGAVYQSSAPLGDSTVIDGVWIVKTASL